LREVVHPGERVAIVANDITRLVRTEVFMPLIAEELNAAGVPERDIFVVFALGNHRRQTPEEQRRILGDDLYRRLRCSDHDCDDPNHLVRIGKTSRGNEVYVNRQVREADRVILTGEIVYHRIAGYSGGRKSLFPGLASAEFIRFNHRLIFDPACESGALEGNPAHEDLLEACRLFDPDFILNVVLNPGGELLHVVAGHYELAHCAGCEFVDRIYSLPIDCPYDLVISSSGGLPLDMDLRQAHKGMENAVRALRPRGVLIHFAECREGAGSRALEEWAARYSSSQEMEAALRRTFLVGAHKAYWVARLGESYRVGLCSSLRESLVRDCHLEPVSDAQAFLDETLEHLNWGAKIAYMPHASFLLPVAPGEAQPAQTRPARTGSS
jgi:nickel-dependent lactate racemase